MLRAILIVFFIAIILGGCSVVPVKTGEVLQFDRPEAYKQDDWYFEGRLAVVGQDSIAAMIKWRHAADRDEVELSGPLSQGKVVMTVVAGMAVVDDGETKKEYEGDVDRLMARIFGVDMPVTALKYWVFGVVDPGRAWQSSGGEGFQQGGWQVSYKEVRQVGVDMLPRKIFIDNQQTKIKLIIDDWEIL